MGKGWKWGPTDRPPADRWGALSQPVEEVHITNRGPRHDGIGRTNQVHVTMSGKTIPLPVVLRFLNAEGLDEFINALQRHRAEVWPQEPPDRS